MEKKNNKASISGRMVIIVALYVVIIFYAYVMEQYLYPGIGIIILTGVIILISFYKKMNQKTNGKTKIVMPDSKSIICPSFPQEKYVNVEIDRQVKAVLNNSLRAIPLMLKLKIKCIWYSLPWCNGEIAVERKHTLESEIKLIKENQDSLKYSFMDPETNQFKALKDGVARLKTADCKVYDRSPSFEKLIKPYKAKGDMKTFDFNVTPICIHIGKDIFCVIPFYVVRFKKSGKYVTTYNSRVFGADKDFCKYTVRIRHVETNAANKQRTYYTKENRYAHEILAFRMAEYLIKYDIEYVLRDKAINCVSKYSQMIAGRTIDSIFFLTQLLEKCDKSPNTRHLTTITSVVPLSNNGTRKGLNAEK